MTKNMTQKGLALGAATALVVAGFSAPASAAGLADTSFVSLAPTTGTAYTVLAGATSTFSISGNEASTVTGGNFKFLVEDASDLIEVAIPAASITDEAKNFRSVAVADNSVVAIVNNSGTTDTVTITDATLAAGLSTGDRVYFTIDLIADDAGASPQTIASDDTLFTVNVSGNDVRFTSDLELTSLTGQDAVDGAAFSVRVAREARDTTDNDFVVDTGTNSASTVSALVLKSDSAVTRSVMVTGWVDSNSNDVIDSTEYASPVRTVTFKKSTEVSVVATIDTPLLGASSLTASATTTPALNGLQVLATDSAAFSLGFTRQGIAGANYDPTATWDSVNNEFDFSIAPNATAVTGLSGQTGTGWGSLSTVIAGTYSATAYLIASTTKSATAYATVAALVADDLKATVAGSADVTPSANETEVTASVVSVRKGQTTAVVEVKVYDSLGALVAAGVDVTATYTNITGTHKVNGTTAANSGTKTALTDANGVATFTVVSTTAAHGDRLDIALKGQSASGSGKGAKFQINWTTATYEIFDLNDGGTAFGVAPVVDRSMNSGASTAFSFAVLDQWGQPIADGHRLRMAATGRTVSTTFATLSNGRALASIADGGITATTNGAIALTVTVEQADGTAEEVTVDEFASGENGAFSIDVLAETNAVTLAADTATTYASVTVDLVDNIAAITLTEQDLRTLNVATPAPAAVATVSGVVTNSVTADPREGVAVTISGDSAFLFQVGERYGMGTLTFIADGSGEFGVNILSNKSVTDSVVTVTSNGVSKTVKVSFNAVAATAGTSLVVDTVSSAMPGSTFSVTATLTDKYGNPVQVTTAGDVAVSYTGPGIVFGTLPNITNAKGQLTFAVLLGSNDKGTAGITVSYDQSSDNDFTGTATGDLDIVVMKSVVVGAVASATKVNVGTFKGYVALYAKGYAGQKMSAIVAGKWIVVASLASDFERVVRFTGAGYTITTKIYIDGVQIGSEFTTVTK